MSETPLGRLAATTGERLQACTNLVFGHAPEGGLESLFRSLDCAEARDLLPALETLRASADGVVVAPIAGARLVARGRLDRGDLYLEAELPPPASDQPLAALLPAAEPPGPRLLAEQRALVHSRVRGDGLDLAALVPEGGALDRLYRLKSRVFSDLVLSGVWELAIYEPSESAGDRLPPLVIGLEFRRRGVGIAAMETFVSEMAQVWPFSPSPFSIGEATGWCLEGLRVLPGLAPCWVATERALVVGWNAAALRLALAPEAHSDQARRDSRLVVALDRFPEAERRLNRSNRGMEIEAQTYPWHRLVITGRRDGDVYRFQLHLD